MNGCSMINHKSQKSINYCDKCKIFMCHQCLVHHNSLFYNHYLIDLTEDNKNIYMEICQEDNHFNKLELFCKTHNKLCCSSCIEKNSKHNKCEICKIEDIKEVKKNNLENNLKILEDLSININDSIDKFKDYYDRMEELKEELKSKILKIFTNIRNKLNEREDEILTELDTLSLNIYPSEKLLKEYERIPKKIREFVVKKKLLDEKLNNSNSLISYIYDCINIENEFSKIKEIQKSVNKFDVNSETKIYFFPEENNLDEIYNDIKSFGKIHQKENEKNNYFITQRHKENIELKKELERIKMELKNSKIRFTMCSRCALNKCLDTKNLNYGNSPHLWEYIQNNLNQIFELEENNDGTFSIKNSASGLYLGFDTDKISFRRRNENSQSFYLNHFDDGYYLFQEKNGGIIDLTDFHIENGSNIGKCGRRNNSEAQQWKLVIHIKIN